MTKKEILQFVEKNPMFSLATIEGAKPRVRMMMVGRCESRARPRRSTI